MMTCHPNLRATAGTWTLSPVPALCIRQTCRHGRSTFVQADTAEVKVCAIGRHSEAGLVVQQCLGKVGRHGNKT